MIEVELLPAQYGDAILIRYGENNKDQHYVLIDSGFEPTTTDILKQLSAEKSIELDLFVMTHIDADHIEGSIYLLQDEGFAEPGRIHDVWFNGWEQINSLATDGLGAVQGEYFSALIRKRKLAWNKAFGSAAVVVPDTGPMPTTTLEGGMKITLLSPTEEKLKALRAYWMKDLAGKLEPGDEKAALALLAEDAKYAPDALGDTTNVGALVAKDFKEDAAKANGSSIAFLAEYAGKRMLFTGDAHPGVLVEALDRMKKGGSKLNVDLLKVAHHGSRHNTSPELLDRVRSKHLLVSTNGAKFRHPDAECIARIADAYQGVTSTLHFNYATQYTTPWKDAALKHKYGYDVAYGDNGSLTVTL